MVGKIVIAECEWWKFNFPRLLILLILTPTILTENCSELQANSEAILKNIHDYAYSLREQWELRENNTREFLKNVSDYINGIVNYRGEMDKLYNAVDLTGFYFLKMDCRSERRDSFDGQRSEYSNINGGGVQPIIPRKIDPKLCNSKTCSGEITPADSSDSRKPQIVDISVKAKLDSLINECIMAIRNNDYDKAISALNLITDDNSIYTVVNSVYKQDTVNAFTILINLSDKLRNVRSSFLLYNAIHHEMEISKDNDAFKYLILIERINRNVLQQKHINDVNNEDALNLLKIIRTKTKQVAKHFLKSIFIFKNSTDNKSGNELLNKTYYSDESLFEEIHQEFLIIMSINGTHFETFDNLLKLTKSRHQPEQELLLHIINIFVLKNYYDEIDTTKVIEWFKEYLKFLQKVKGKVNKETIKRYSENLKKLISLSLYNILTSEKLCIKNIGFGTYLTTGGDNDGIFYKVSGSSRKRGVYLSEKCRNIEGYCNWKLEHMLGNAYYIKNVKLTGYIMPPVECHMVWGYENRLIIDEKNNWAYWRIELNGDYVYIKSVTINGYLYGSNRTTDEIKDWYRGHAYTRKNEYILCPNQECVWLIEDCSNIVD